MTYNLVIDVGSTTVKAGIYLGSDEVGIAKKQLTTYSPNNGFYEQDPLEVLADTLEVIESVLRESGIDSNQIGQFGLTTQRNTVVLWNPETGIPYYSAIMWQDQRGLDLVSDLLQDNKIDQFITALMLGKLKWLFHEMPELFTAALKGQVLYGGIESWLIWKLSGKKIHGTDYSFASTTHLFDDLNLCWNDQVIRAHDLPLSIFPKVYPSAYPYGKLKLESLGLECPIVAVIGDQQASLFGHGCCDCNDVKATIGTGSFILVNCGHNSEPPPEGFLKNIAWGISHEVTYAVEGSVLASGSAAEWAVNQLKIADSFDDLEKIATEAENNAGVYFIPALTGLGTPSWDSKAQGLLIGLSKSTTGGHIARAVIEAMAFQIREVLQLLLGEQLKDLTLKIDGGPTSNQLFVRTLANVLQIPVLCANNRQKTLQGVAMLVEHSKGHSNTNNQILKESSDYKTYIPTKSIDEIYQKWTQALNRAKGWLD